MAKIVGYKTHTFEQLCVRKEIGFSFDVNAMFKPSDPSSYDDVVFKILSKIDSSLFLLNTHGVEVEKFTVIAIPLKNQSQVRASSLSKSKNENCYAGFSPSLQVAWEYLSDAGWHCLQCLAIIQPDSLPDNGSRRYSLYHYVTSLMDVIRSNYMFQKFKNNFDHETLEMFNDDDIKNSTSATIGLLWKRIDSLVDKPLTFNHILKQLPFKQSAWSPASPKRKAESDEFSIRKARASLDSREECSRQMIVTDVDDEITIRGRSPVGDSVGNSFIAETCSTRGRGKTANENTFLSTSDVTLDLDKKTEVKSGRKSLLGRKSLSSDWLEEEKKDILRMFDNLNPDVTEQKRIALTCKYATVQMGKELPSKLLYQWIQKKGRPVHRSISSFNLAEEEQRTVAVQFFSELDPNVSSEASRVNYTLKYLNSQFGLSIPSKQLYFWLSEKPKSAKRSSRKN